MYSPDDAVLICGWGVLRRAAARQEAAQRFAAIVALIEQGTKVPEGAVDLASAFLAAAEGPAFEEYLSPVSFED